MMFRYIKINNLYFWDNEVELENEEYPSESSKNILNILSVASPHRAHYRKFLNPKTISLLPFRDLPFGPDPYLLIKKLFKDLKKAILAVSEYFNLKEITIHNTENLNVINIPMDEKIRLTSKTYFIDKYSNINLDVDLLELYSLYCFATEGKAKRLISISFFTDTVNNCSVISEPDVAISDLVNNTDILNYLGIAREDISGVSFIDPVTGKIFYSPEQSISEENNKNGNIADLNTYTKNTENFYKILSRPLKRDTLILLNRNHQFLPKGGFLFSFPYFDRRILFKKLPKRQKIPKVKVCINCLACVRHCPAGIHPSYIYHNLINKNIEEAENLGIYRCTLCGKCTFTCPANLPLHNTFERFLLYEKSTGEIDE